MEWEKDSCHRHTIWVCEAISYDDADDDCDNDNFVDLFLYLLLDYLSVPYLRDRPLSQKKNRI